MLSIQLKEMLDNSKCEAKKKESSGLKKKKKSMVGIRKKNKFLCRLAIIKCKRVIVSLTSNMHIHADTYTLFHVYSCYNLTNTNVKNMQLKLKQCTKLYL